MLGIDPSLTGTGLAVLGAGGLERLVTVRPRSLKRGSTVSERVHRLDEILRAARYAALPSTDLAVIEGPSYGSAAGQSGHHERAGLWWTLACQLVADDIPVAVVPPQTRAKWATGRGRADKAEVIEAMRKRYPDANIEDDNQADALVLASMGMHHLMQGRVSGVEWPQMPSDGMWDGIDV